MPKTKHIVTLPDGKTAQRVSQNRTYSHVVVGRRLYEHDLARAQDPHWRKTDASNFAFHQSFVDGTSKYLGRDNWESEEVHAARVIRERAEYAERQEGCTTPEAYADLQLVKRLAKVEADRAAGRFEAWGALTWASRLDLAQKAAGHREWSGYETRVLACQHA